jgi:transketolase
VSRFSAADGLRRGGYIPADAPDGDPALILIASGSEFALTLVLVGTPHGVPV